jgi:predicted secreted protein
LILSKIIHHKYYDNLSLKPSEIKMRLYKHVIKILLPIIFLTALLPHIDYAQQLRQAINNTAVWNPTMEDMENLSSKCGYLRGDELYSCFLNLMESVKAPIAAVEFARLLNGRGYMKSFKPMGVVDVAFVYYPFEKENNNGCYIVNGKPGLINVDDFVQLDMTELEKTPGYIQLKQKYSHVFLYAEDRAGTNYPSKEFLPDKGERIIVNYALRDGCSSCELLSYVDFGFNFDSSGNFRGAKYIALRKIPVLDSVVAGNSNPANVFSDPSQAIILTHGEEFAIVLQSNHSAGLRWELAETLDEKVVTFLGSNFVNPFEALPNSAGKEIWNFRTTGKGATVLKFKYIRNWQNQTKELQNYNFTVEVN